MEKNGATLLFRNPIGNAISRVRFAPQSDNLLISSWDSCLRLYDVGSSKLRLEATSEASLLDCYFQDEFVAFSSGSDGSIRRYTFRCHPKSAYKRLHLASVNDIVFNLHIGSAFFTGDNEGYVSAWNAQSRKRLFELPRYPNSVASLSINHRGQLLAVASSYTYQEANEIEDPPQIFIQDVDNCNIRSGS